MKRKIFAIFSVLVFLTVHAQNATVLTRASKALTLYGTYMNIDKQSADATAELDYDASGITIKITPSGSQPINISLHAPMQYFRKDKDVTRQKNYKTGVAVMLGDQQRSYFRFCSYFDGDNSSVAYLEVGQVVTKDGKSKMERQGVFTIEQADFFNIVSGKRDKAFADFQPEKENYLNALWGFFERIYNQFSKK